MIAASDLPARAGLRDLARYAWPERRWLAAGLVLGLAAAVAGLAAPIAIQRVIQVVGDEGPVAGPATVVLLLFVVAAVLAGLQRYTLGRAGEGIVLGVRTALAERMMRLEVREHDRLRLGDLMSRLVADTTLLRAAVTSGVVGSLADAATAVGAIALMAWIDATLLGIVAAAVAAALAVAWLVLRRVRVASERAQAEVGLMASAAERALGAVRTVKAGGAEAREAAAITGRARAAFDAGVRVTRLQALLDPVAILAVQGAFALVLAVGGAQVATGAMAVGDLVAFLLYLFLLVVPLGAVLGGLGQLQAGMAAVQRIREVEALPVELHEPGAGAAAAGAPPPGVVVEDLTFGYRPERTVLAHVDFSAPAGGHTALVGPSGSGKSTLLQLVERFYVPEAGRILVGGIDVRAIPRDELRSQVAYVEQEAPVLAGTLRDNLRLSAPAAGDAALRDALVRARLGELLDRLPAGLDTEVGDRGVLLSGGERQRLAIARALASGPRVLLLDEPTAQLDAESEAGIRRAVEDLAGRCTVISAAHRLSTVLGADRIVVLEGGRVRAVGTHEELVAGDGLYRRLAAAQRLVPAPAS